MRIWRMTFMIVSTACLGTLAASAQDATNETLKDLLPRLELLRSERDVSRWRDTERLACADPRLEDDDLAESCGVEPSEQVLRQRILNRIKK